MTNTLGRPKVLVIGVDGLRFDRIADADAPRLRELMRAGLFAPSLIDVTRGAETVSGPGWSTVASGVWPDKHGVVDNTFVGKRYGEHPDFLTLAKRADPGLSTFAAVNWPPLADEGTFSAEIDVILRGDGEENGYFPEDARVAAGAAELLRTQDPDAGFVYLGSVDAAGHGWGALSEQYVDAITAVDGWIGEVLDAVTGRPTYAQEDWLILVTTDHGHTDEGGHGEFSPRERETFLLAVGPGVPAGRRDGALQVDVAPTALRHLGVTRPERLDGHCVLESLVD